MIIVKVKVEEYCGSKFILKGCSKELLYLISIENYDVEKQNLILDSVP